MTPTASERACCWAIASTRAGLWCGQLDGEECSDEAALLAAPSGFGSWPPLRRRRTWAARTSSSTARPDPIRCGSSSARRSSIPGLAEITVRLQDRRQVDRVTVQPVQWQAGLKGAPPPDVAMPVPGAPGVWSSQLWLMMAGSYNIRSRSRGPDGEGDRPGAGRRDAQPAARHAAGYGRAPAGARRLSVRRRDLARRSGHAGELAAAGQSPVDRRRAGGRGWPRSSAPRSSPSLWGGKSWWDSVRRQSAEGLFQPFTVKSTARGRGRPAPALDWRSRMERPREWSPLIAGPWQADAPVPPARARPRRLRASASGAAGQAAEELPVGPPAVAGRHLPRSTPTSSTRAVSRRRWWIG